MSETWQRQNKSTAWRAWLAATAMALALLLAACGGGSGGSGTPDTITLAGTITAAPGSAADGDTNDPRSPLRFNNRPSEAQSLPNPVRLGGYVTATPTGWLDDRFGVIADPRDFYRVELSAGQSIELRISDWQPGGADLDLWLYETGDPITPVLVDASLGTGSVESLIAPADGTYWVEVRAFRGGSNYVLTIGDVSGSPQTTGDLRLSAPSVSGEVLLRTRPLTAVQRASGVADPMERLASAGLSLAAGDPERLARMTIPRPELSLQKLGLPGAQLDPSVVIRDEQQRRLETLLMIKTLRNMPEVELAAPNQRLELQRVPNDPGFAQQWHYPLIQLPQAWDLTTGGERDVIVAVPDTGVFLNHEDLRGQLVPGYDFIDGVPGGDDPGDGAFLGDSSWHGTHVAGTVAARTNNALGVAGVAWGARIMPLRVLGPGGGTEYELIQGLRFALGLPNDSRTVPARPADVINISLGGPSTSPFLTEVVQAARDAGVILVAAAGNQATNRPLFPAALDGVLSVAAVGPDRRPASYSNFGPTIALSAPGGDQLLGTTAGVLSTLVQVVGGERRSRYGFLDGTSMASPHVAGTMALMKSLYPALDYDTVLALLASGLITEDLGPPGFDERHGWGLIDALQAVFQAQTLAAGGVAPGLLIAEPNTLDFGAVITDRTLRLRRQGDEPLSVSRVDSDAAWLSVQPLAVDAAGLGDYRVAVDRRGLVPANYSAAITVTSSGNRVLTVPVTMRVGAIGPGDVGLIYVLLLDRDFQTVASQALLGQNGRYAFRLAGIPPGQYYLVAGTDADNDGFICDPGEACGAYPTIGIPDPIRFDRNRTNLDFVVGYFFAEVQGLMPQDDGCRSASRSGDNTTCEDRGFDRTGPGFPQDAPSEASRLREPAAFPIGARPSEP